MSSVRPLPMPPPCGAGRDIRYGPAPHYAGPWPNLALMRRTGFKSLEERGLHDIGVSVPQEFSWRKRAPDMIEDGSRNQANCGSCWAFTTTSVLGDRYALAYGIKSPRPSVAYLLSYAKEISDANPGMPPSDPNTTCCFGGDVQSAARYLSKASIGSEACWPYSFIQEYNNAPCPKQKGQYQASPPLTGVNADCCASCCGNVNAKAQFSVNPKGPSGQGDPAEAIRDMKSSTEVDIAKTIYHIKMDILQNGPIATSIRVPGDFESFWNANAGTVAIYRPPSGGETVGAHAVCITGWGGSEGDQWWEMRNSWGSPGYIRFAMTKESDPISMRTGIDVPIHLDENFNSIPGVPGFGGCVSFLPGPLPSGFSFPQSAEGALTTPGKGIGKIGGGGDGGDIWKSGSLGGSGKSKLLIAIGVAIIITIILAVFIVKMNG